MVTKNWTSKVGLSRFPNNALEDFLLTNEEISQEKVSTFKKIYIYTCCTAAWCSCAHLNIHIRHL
jgi:hypothetical protein